MGASAVHSSTAGLIEEPVGSIDYRALEKSNQMLFRTNLFPIFNSDTRKDASRIITLIDVGYEKGRLVMRMEEVDLYFLFSNLDVSSFGAKIVERLQFESEVAKVGFGADQRGIYS